MVVGLPTAPDVETLTKMTPHVRDELQIGTGGVVYGAGYLGAGYPKDGTGEFGDSHDASVNFEFNLAELGDPHRLKLGLLSDAAIAGGFDSLSFAVTENGVVRRSWFFDSLGGAHTQFTDQVVNIGDFLTGASSTLDLGLQFSLNSHTPLQAYNVAFLIGVAPVPELCADSAPANDHTAPRTKNTPSNTCAHAQLLRMPATKN